MKNLKDESIYINDIEQDISVKKPISEILKANNREVSYSSTVFYIELSNAERLVLKIYPEAQLRELTEVVGEVAAYKISCKLGFNLVPETKIAGCYDVNVSKGRVIGTVQSYIDIGTTEDKSCYYKFLAEDISPQVQQLKLFWFVLGQWDMSCDNVLFTKTGTPIAIDNANIAHIQVIPKYGAHSFVWVPSFQTKSSDNTGSVEKPELISGTSADILNVLHQRFESIPLYLENRLKTKPNNLSEFTYFAENNKVWRCFEDKYESVPVNFIKTFSKNTLEILEKFKNINFSELFASTIDELMKMFKYNIDVDLKDSVLNNLAQILNEHFEARSNDMRDRVKLVCDCAQNHLENPTGLLGQEQQDFDTNDQVI